MVVIAIISILAGLLLPALSKAKEAARSTLCLNQMKQIYLGFTFYWNDNKDSFPPFLWKPYGAENPLYQSGHVGTWADYFYIYYLSDRNWAAISVPYGTNYPSTMGRQKNCKVFDCPSRPKGSAWDISANKWAMDPFDQYTKSSYLPKSHLRLTLPQQILITDVNPSNEGGYISGVGYPLSYNYGVDERHGGNAANYIYVDGHGEKSSLNREAGLYSSGLPRYLPWRPIKAP